MRENINHHECTCMNKAVLQTCILCQVMDVCEYVQDSDVTAEREKVKNGDITDDHIVVIRNLVKV